METKSIVRRFGIFNTTLDKLRKYFMVFNFRGTQSTAKYRVNYTTRKFSFLRYFHRKTCTKGLDGMANSVDPDQTAPLGAV